MWFKIKVVTHPRLTYKAYSISIVSMSKVEGNKDASLTMEEAGDQGCGMGTENACYALTMTNKGLECLTIGYPPLALRAGLELSWRVNVDPEDGKVWCPKGILANSKNP